MDKDRYRESVEVELSCDDGIGTLVDDVIMRKLISSLYEMISTTVDITLPGELDAPLFAVWSQQWPRLRRNFRFQTAASRVSRSNSSVRFDVTALLTQRESEFSRQDGYTPSWLSTAVLDAQEGSSGFLRSFLWNYGRDVRRQRGSFRPLVEINALDRDAQDNSAQRIIEIVTEAFPTLDDAVYLKQDLIDGVLVADAQAELIQFIVLNEMSGTAIFPTPTATGIAKLSHLWPQRPEKILQLLEITSDIEEPIGRLVFETVINIVQTPEFWPLTGSYPRARERMVQIQPELLINYINKLDDAALIELLPLVSVNTESLTKLIANLISRDNEMLVNITLEHFSEIAVAQIVSAINDRNIGVADVWLQGLKRRPTLLLQADVMSLVSRASLLYELADGLGWLSLGVITAGVAPWNAALMNATNDLQESQADTLACFLVVLAFKSGGDSGLQIVEKFYNELHVKILKSRLPKSAKEMLSPELPEIGWAWGWDMGLRFRLAVVASYIRYEWPPQSYAALAHDKNGRGLLADAAADTSGGHAYFKAVSK
ncbi:hypothetical protein AAH211_11195 [Serratia fonticola]|uniref:hypothetical protein n=1 Tax=Serratia fonticola TaxID=47917 RepID=UPI0039871F11